MKIEFTHVDTSYACRELSLSLRDLVPSIRKMVLHTYEQRDDKRTLVIVLTCPCCAGDRRLDIKNAVLVTPFKGIDPKKYKIHQISKYPPPWLSIPTTETHDLSVISNSRDEFMNLFRATIDHALE